jgi:hypothetical protein
MDFRCNDLVTYQGRKGKIIETFHDRETGDVIVVEFQDGSKIGVHPQSSELRLLGPEEQKESTPKWEATNLNRIDSVLDGLDVSLNLLTECVERLTRLRYN